MDKINISWESNHQQTTIRLNEKCPICGKVPKQWHIYYLDGKEDKRICGECDNTSN